MKKKKMIIVAVAIMVIVVVTAVIRLLSKCSEITFEAIVQDVVTLEDGEVRLIVERTTEIYDNSMNSLGISEETALVNEKNQEISVEDFKSGAYVEVTLKNAFVEEIPFYYPTVYEVKLIDME